MNSVSEHIFVLCFWSSDPHKDKDLIRIHSGLDQWLISNCNIYFSLSPTEFKIKIM